jgi:hypothetical protein
MIMPTVFHLFIWIIVASTLAMVLMLALVAATSALGRWRLRPGTGFDGLIIPVTFTF